MVTLTGIDLPANPSCGSLILAEDIYRQWPSALRFVCIESSLPTNGFLSALDTAKMPDHPARQRPERDAYVEALSVFLANQLHLVQPDVVHIHHLTFGMAKAWSRVLPPSMPVVAVCHGTDILAAWDDADHRDVVRQTLMRAQACVFPTLATARQAWAIEPRCEGKSHIIPWGIPDACFDTLRPPSEVGGARILYAGRLTDNKGARDIVEALTLLPNHHLTLVGPEPQHRAVFDWCAQLDVLDRVTVMPFLPRRQLWSVMDEHDIYVMTTNRLEAFGLAAVEALARRMRVVYADVDGLREVIADAGVAYTAGSSDALCAAIQCAQSLDIDMTWRHARQFTLDRTRQALHSLTCAIV